ncbi:zinc ribbon domain-containing protein [Desulforudis sp. 1088]|uniref:zinc ribbon domain-containing protein n=1 Tax=unclassified Candidatus Desulforudis TaxID=2635950 RepID=UPI003487F066
MGFFRRGILDGVAVPDKWKAVTQTLTDRSRRLAEAAKARAAVVGIETAIARRERALGHFVLTMYRKNGIDYRKIRAHCEEIARLYDELDELNRKITAIVANRVFCSYCGNSMEAGARYCPHCGRPVVQAAARLPA